MYLQDAWSAWRESDALKRPDGEGAGTGDARQKWLLVLLRELGYGHVQATPGGLTIGEDSYPISHRWESVPIHLLGPGLNLDKRTPKEAGAARRAPQAMVQEFLNREDNYLWAILSNGLKLRLLRDSTSLAGSAYIEFDLETIFDSDLYSEFQLLWQLCHESRLAKRGGAEAPAEDCWMETWRSESVQAGARALDKLGAGVEKALNSLGTGFLRHPDNGWILEALHTGELRHRDFHKALLRTAYRLLFLFVVEDRGALLDPEGNKLSHQRYDDYFSTQRLRKMARTRDGGPHPDLWRTQKMVLSALGGDGLSAIGLPALGGLFDPDPRAKKVEGQPQEDLLLGAELANHDFLKAIRSLGWVSGKSGRMQPADYRHLGAEELGSVYESLLEFVAKVDTETRSFELVLLSGNDRKTTGSYYTPPNLVSALLDTALDPLLDAAVNGGGNAADRESRLLALTVCDPASGSGGFLVAAARRIARRVAEVRAGDNEPTPSEVQTALHDVVERCIYGVDMNDLAAELAKVSLWLEAMQPGKPLGFLDARIKIGNSLLGTTPALLASGVPDGAFTVLEGDDKKHAAEAKKRNKAENTRKVDQLFGSLGQDAFSFGGTTSALAALISQRQNLVKPVSSAQEARARAKAYTEFDHSEGMEQKRLHADAWCAAFVWPLQVGEPEPPTSSIVRQLGESGTSAGYAETVDRIRQLADEYRFFHWQLEFPEIFGDPSSGEEVGSEGWPGGFSCVLGNPPWERLKLQEKEFFAARGSSISEAANTSSRRRLIEKLEFEDPVLHLEFQAAKRRSEAQSNFLRKSGRFPYCGRGDVNTYSVFAELFHGMTGPKGRSGVIVPTGIATDETTQHFFKNLVQSKSLVSLFDFRNKGFFPDIAGAQGNRFCLLTMSIDEISSTDYFFRGTAMEELSLESRHFKLSTEDIMLLNPNTGTCPIFLSKYDAELTLGIYRRVPVLMNEGGMSSSASWNISYLRMFDMSTDSDVFIDRRLIELDVEVDGGTIATADLTAGKTEVVPLYEAKMFHHFNYRFGDYAGLNLDTGKSIRQLPTPPLEKLQDSNYVVQPRYWVEKRLVEERLQSRWTKQWFVSFRDVTSGLDERTMISSILPMAAVGHPAPLLFAKSHSELICANFSSFALDYVARQKVGGTHMTYFNVNQLPVIPLSSYLESCDWDMGLSLKNWIYSRILELNYTSSELRAFAFDLGDIGEAFVWNSDRRDYLRAELDGAYFHLYGLDRRSVEHVMDSFSILKKKDLYKFGEFRTKRLILEAYDAMQDAIDTDTPFESTLNPPPGHGPRHPAKETVS